jgi:hypothetical protein
LTLDFDVTPRKLLDAGLWPLQNIPATALDDGIYGIERYPLLKFPGSSGFAEFAGIGTPDWRLDAKCRILEAVYGEAASSLDPTQAFKDLSDDIKYNDKFWVNPFTGRNMEASNLKGDYRFVDSSRLLNEGLPRRFGGPRDMMIYGLSFRTINHRNFPDEVGRQTSGADCCIFKYHYDTYTSGGGPFEYTFNCPCTETSNWVCKIVWRYDCSCAVSYWSSTSDYGCGDSLPPGYTRVDCGGRAPDTIFAALCHATILSEPCVAHVCLAMQDPCYAAYQNFMGNLQNGYGASLPGPACDCR